MASFVLSFFPLDVLGGIWDLIESVSEGFLTYSCMVYLHIFAIFTKAGSLNYFLYFFHSGHGVALLDGSSLERESVCCSE